MRRRTEIAHERGAWAHVDGFMRISVSNWATTEDDVDRSVDAILRIAAHNP